MAYIKKQAGGDGGGRGDGGGVNKGISTTINTAFLITSYLQNLCEIPGG